MHTSAHPTASVPATQSRDASAAPHHPPQAQQSSAPHVFKHRQQSAPRSRLLLPLPPHLTRRLKPARIRASLTALGRALGARVHMRCLSCPGVRGPWAEMGGPYLASPGNARCVSVFVGFEMAQIFLAVSLPSLAMTLPSLRA